MGDFKVLFLVCSLISFESFGGSFYGDALIQYGKECAEKMGEIPEVNCIEEGTIIPTRVNGVEITTDEQANTLLREGKCDEPQLLSDSCAPFSRLIHRQTGTVHTVIQCRRTSLRPKMDNSFPDVAIIQYDSATGNTCFFQAFPNRGIVPAPYKRGRDTTGDNNAKSFWSSGGSNGCMSCHSGNVFVRSPWVYGAKNPDGSSVLPWIDHPTRVKRISEQIAPPTTASNSHGEFYGININEAAFDVKYPPSDEEKRRLSAGSLASAGSCTECHSVGGPGYYSKFMDRFTRPSSGGYSLSETAAKFPKSHWMPPDHGNVTDSTTGRSRPIKDDAEYRSYYERAYKAVKLCGENPTMTVDMLVGGAMKKVPVCYADEATIPATTHIDLGGPVSVAPIHTMPPPTGSATLATPMTVPMRATPGSVTPATTSATPLPTVATPAPSVVTPPAASTGISPAVNSIAPVMGSITH